MHWSASWCYERTHGVEISYPYGDDLLLIWYLLSDFLRYSKYTITLATHIELSDYNINMLSFGDELLLIWSLL